MVRGDLWVWVRVMWRGRMEVFWVSGVEVGGLWLMLAAAT